MKNLEGLRSADSGVRTLRVRRRKAAHDTVHEVDFVVCKEYTETFARYARTSKLLDFVSIDDFLTFESLGFI